MSRSILSRKRRAWFRDHLSLLAGVKLREGRDYRLVLVLHGGAKEDDEYVIEGLTESATKAAETMARDMQLWALRRNFDKRFVEEGFAVQEGIDYRVQIHEEDLLRFDALTPKGERALAHMEGLVRKKIRK